MFPFKKTLALMTLTMLAAGVAMAADHRDRFEGRMFRAADGGELPYRLLSPKKIDPQAKYPLVIFFHGAGERGKDNRVQLVHGMNDFASDEIMEKYPAFVAAPQCPDNMQWVDTPWSADSHTMPENPSVPMQRAFELIDSLEKNLPIDASRIYVTGLSMGGFGAWDAIQRQPQRFAACVPVCGGGDAATVNSIKHVPVWAFHGDQDGAVKPKRSRDMIAALKAAGGSPKYTEYPGVGHDSWSATYRDPQMYAWLFSQKKK